MQADLNQVSSLVFLCLLVYMYVEEQWLKKKKLGIRGDDRGRKRHMMKLHFN